MTKHSKQLTEAANEMYRKELEQRLQKLTYRLPQTVGFKTRPMPAIDFKHYAKVYLEAICKSKDIAIKLKYVNKLIMLYEQWRELHNRYPFVSLVYSIRDVQSREPSLFVHNRDGGQAIDTGVSPVNVQ